MVQVAAIRPKNAAGHRRVSLASARSRTAGQQQALSFVPEPASQALHYDDPPPRPQISARTQALLDAAKQAQDVLVERAVAEANRLRVQKEEVSQLFREFRQQRVYEVDEEKRRIAREQEEGRRRRLALYEERQSIEYERIRLDRLRREQEIERRKEEILQRRRQLEEERHAEQEAAAEARRRAEAIRQREREEAERIRQERLRQCAVCLDEVDMGLMLQLPCSHWYCVEDLESAFQNAIQARRPFQCCREDVPVQMLPTLEPDFRRQYELMVLEQRTTNPVFCANQMCRLFIPPNNYRGPHAVVCPICEYRTCRMCRQPAHGGVCAEDADMQATLALSQRNGWRQCPTCRNMVEKISGCNHMSCRCGGHFCYVCGVTWGLCGHG